MKMSNNIYTVPESYPMNGGDVINSYTKNSNFQVSSILLSISPISYTLLILFGLACCILMCISFGNEFLPPK